MTKTKKILLATLMALLLMSMTVLVGCGSGDESAKNNGDVIEWSFYSPYGPEDSACCEIWTDLFKQVEEETNGQLKITTYWSGQHPYEGSDMLKVVDEGIAELSHFYGGYVSSVDPVFGVDTLPLLFPADSMTAWDINTELWGGFSQKTDGLLEKRLQEEWNASMIHMIPATSQRLMTMGYSADGADSLKGHKVRVYSTEFGKFVEALGGTPVTLTSSEVYTGLSTNLIDGAITSVVFADSSGYFDYTDTINLWEISQSSDGLMVGLDALNELPEDVRETFLRIMNESATAPQMLEIEQNDSLVEELENEGVKIVTPSEDVRNTIAAELEKTVWNPWIESAGEVGEQIIKFIDSKR